MTVKERKVGRRIARRTQIVFTGLDILSADDEAASSVYPHEKFEAFLEQQESKLAAMLKHFGLPEPGRYVVWWDKDTRRNWRYAVEPGTGPEKNGATTTEQFLMTWRERADSFWYLGRLLFLLKLCRSAIEREAWFELAGRACYLGRDCREMELMFPDEPGLQAFEMRVTGGADKGNQTKKQIATKWQRRVTQISFSNAGIDRTNASSAAREILDCWPAGESKPSVSSVRRYLAKRAVLPEMKNT